MHQVLRIRDGPLLTTSTPTVLVLLLACLVCLASAQQLPTAMAAAGYDEITAAGAAPAVVAMAVAARASSNDCPANYYSCASQGSKFDGICCPYDQVCSLASDGRPACCPSGDVCTGSAPSTYVTTTAAASYVPNAYYSFPYILPANVAATTALADVNACDAVLDQCSRTFSQCTSDLENGEGGGGNGVTVVIAGSTTLTRGAQQAAATTTLAAASAASVCSSLSSQACGGLPTNTAGCASLFAGAQATGFSTGNGSTRQRRLPSRVHIVVIATTVSAVIWMAF